MNRKKDVAIQVLKATLQLNKKDKMLYVPLQFREYENHGLLDTGAIRSVMSEDELRRILSAHPAALLEEYPALQSPNRKRKHRPGPETGTTSLLHRR